MSAINLRPWSEEDLDLLRRANTPEMTEHLAGPETEANVIERHERYLRYWQTGEAHMFAIVDGDVGIGGIGWWLAQWRGDDVYETGWSVVPEAQGKGAAGAALALVIEDARLHGERSLLTAFPSVANPASNRLCASAGFAHAGVEESEFRGSMLTVNAWTLDLATPH